MEKNNNKSHNGAMPIPILFMYRASDLNWPQVWIKIMSFLEIGEKIP